MIFNIPVYGLSQAQSIQNISSLRKDCSYLSTEFDLVFLQSCDYGIENISLFFDNLVDRRIWTFEIPTGTLSANKALSLRQKRLDEVKVEMNLDNNDIIILLISNGTSSESISIIDDNVYQIEIPINGMSRLSAISHMTERIEYFQNCFSYDTTLKLIFSPIGECGSVVINVI